MTGRQFSYYCLDDDLADIQQQVFDPLQGQLMAVTSADGRHELSAVDDFSQGRTADGEQATRFVLLPPPALQLIVHNGPWIDHSLSHLMEVGRCNTDGRIIRIDRFWYETRFFEGEDLMEKPPAFIAWAEQVFKATKKLLKRHTVQYQGHDYKEWFGPRAWEAVSQGTLTPEPN